jgi:excisionase family DNA binding protein
MVTSTAELSNRLALNVNETAMMLGCSRRHVYRMMESDELPFLLMGAHRWVPVGLLSDWLNARTIVGSAPPQGRRSPRALRV